MQTKKQRELNEESEKMKELAIQEKKKKDQIEHTKIINLENKFGKIRKYKDEYKKKELEWCKDVIEKINKKCFYYI